MRHRQGRGVGGLQAGYLPVIHEASDGMEKCTKVTPYGETYVRHWVGAKRHPHEPAQYLESSLTYSKSGAMSIRPANLDGWDNKLRTNMCLGSGPLVDGFLFQMLDVASWMNSRTSSVAPQHPRMKPHSTRSSNRTSSLPHVKGVMRMRVNRRLASAVRQSAPT